MMSDEKIQELKKQVAKFGENDVQDAWRLYVKSDSGNTESKFIKKRMRDNEMPPAELWAWIKSLGNDFNLGHIITLI